MNNLLKGLSFKDAIDEDIIVSHKFITEFEKKADKCNNEIIQMKNQELDRILKEFMMNDYERRFNVSLDQMISCLIGEDNTEMEFAHQSKILKVL